MTYKAKTFIKAIPGSGANISRIASRVGCDWHTVKRALDRYPTVLRAFMDEHEKVTDKAEDNIVQVINSGPSQANPQAKPHPQRLSTSKWWIERMRKEQYSTRQEVTGADGEPISLGITLEERKSRLVDILEDN